MIPGLGFLENTTQLLLEDGLAVARAQLHEYGFEGLLELHNANLGRRDPSEAGCGHGGEMAQSSAEKATIWNQNGYATEANLIGKEHVLLI